jgi:hypothetical protein
MALRIWFRRKSETQGALSPSGAAEADVGDEPKRAQKSCAKAQVSHWNHSGA